MQIRVTASYKKGLLTQQCLTDWPKAYGHIFINVNKLNAHNMPESEHSVESNQWHDRRGRLLAIKKVAGPRYQEN